MRVGSLLAVLVACVIVSMARAAGFEAMPFAADSRVELPGGIGVALDDDGNAQLMRSGSLLLQIELLAQDGDGAWQRAEGPHRLLHRHWPYFHLDSVVFWQRAQDDPRPGPHAFRVRAATPMQWVETDIRTHGSVGGGTSRQLRYAQWTLEDGSLLALFDPSGRALEPDASDPGVGRFDEVADGGWLLALAAAEDPEILVQDIGQALRSLDGRPQLGEIEPPPLCERCRNPHAGELRLRVARDDEGFQLIAQIARAQLELPHERPLFATLSIGAIKLRRHLLESSATRAVYRVPADAPELDALLQELAYVVPRVRLLNPSGVDFEFDRVAVELPQQRGGDPAVPRAEFPRLLSNRLLDASPNPFQEQTWVRVTMPATIEQAFDLDEELRAKLDPLAAPPFGPQPQLRVRIYNVKGKLVRSLFDGIASPGDLSLSWNGEDDEGQLVATGAYYLNLQIEEYAVTRRITMLKP